MRTPFCTRSSRGSSRRAAAALALGLAVLTLSPAAAGAGTTRGSAPVDPFADLLVATATSDLRYPWDAMPPVVSGVLASRSAARVEALRALEQAQQEAAAAAYAEALRAAARSSGGGSSSGGGGAKTSSGGSCNGDFDCFKACTLDIESDGNYGAVSPDGTYRGAWQFDQSTWNGAVARAGYPEWSGRDPAAAPPDVQDAAARQLYSERGNQPWGGRC